MLDTCQDIRDTDETTDVMVDKHSRHVTQIKDWNMDKSERLIYK